MLTKKDKKKRYNKKFPKTGAHTFDGFFEKMTKQTREAFGKDNLGGAIGGIAGAATGAISTGIDAAKLQGIEEAQAEIDKQKAFQSTASSLDELLAEQAGLVNLKTDYSHKDFMQSGGDFAKTMISGALQGAGSGAAAGPWSIVAGISANAISGLAGRLAANIAGKVEASEINQGAKQSNKAAAQTLTSKAAALDQNADLKAQAAYAAEGGAINPSFSSNFSSPITEFNAGGSHEENPYDGIPQGTAPDGLPNLVEEGEVKYDNYIFSDRLMLNKEDKKKYKFLKGKTYADAAKAIKKELGIDERPNDLIAKTDLEEHLNILSTLQEEERAKRGLRGENRMMYKDGGHLFGGDEDEYIDMSSASNEDLAGAGIPVFEKNEGLLPTPKSYGSGVDPLILTSSDIKTMKSISPNKKSKNGGSGWNSSLQAAPALGSAVGVIESLFDKPTYKHPKELTKAENPVASITYTPTHQDIKLPRFDKNFYMNKADAQAAATRRAIREQTASNPYASTLHLLVADAQGNVTRGDIRRQGEEMEINRILQEAQFNSTGRRADKEGLLKAASANATLQDKALTRDAEKKAMAARLKMAEDQAWDTATSANMTSLFDNLGAIGRGKKEIGLAAIKALGEGKLTPEQLAGYAKTFPELAKLLGYKGAYGGKLRKKKGYTI